MGAQMVFILSGKQGGGKTTTLIEVISLLTKKGLGIHGFVAPGEWKEAVREKFFIQDIQSNRRIILCKDTFEEGFEKYGRFYFDSKSIAFGEKLMLKAKPGELLVIDEIGRFELNGKVWSELFRKLLEKSENPLLIVIRDEFVADIVHHYKLKNSVVFQCNEKPGLISEKIISML